MAVWTRTPKSRRKLSSRRPLSCRCFALDLSGTRHRTVGTGRRQSGSITLVR
jgi:hypothetical protein